MSAKTARDRIDLRLASRIALPRLHVTALTLVCVSVQVSGLYGPAGLQENRRKRVGCVPTRHE
jgi:hypothetical protein